MRFFRVTLQLFLGTAIFAYGAAQSLPHVHPRPANALLKKLSGSETSGHRCWQCTLPQNQAAAPAATAGIAAVPASWSLPVRTSRSTQNPRLEVTYPRAPPA